MDLRSCVTYLITHGPYRRPRLLDFQYLRIERHRRLLAERKDIHYKELQVFCDPNFPRQSYEATPSGLASLVEFIPKNKVDAIFVDIDDDQVMSTGLASFVIMRLKHTGCEVYNVDDHDNALIEEHLAEGPIPLVGVFRRQRSDAEDFVTLFPALSAAIADEILCHGAYKHSYEESLQYIHRLASENAYQTRIPLLSPWRGDDLTDQALETHDAMQKEREETEELYQIAPDTEPELIDKGIYTKPVRDNHGFARAEQRLQQIGFAINHVGRVKSYTSERDDVIVYADPRKQGIIDFAVFRKAEGTEPRCIGHFYLLDRWNKDIRARYESRLAHCVVTAPKAAQLGKPS